MKRGIGLMSGTSLDGIDAVLVEITGKNEIEKVDVLAFEMFPYQEDLKQKIILESEPSTSSVAKICALNFELGKEYSKAVQQLCSNANVDIKTLDFVANHGQTIHHMPVNEMASSMQIGESSIIAYDHHVDVVDNFRVMDIAANGQGAPLVPFSEQILYQEKDKTKVLLNIGGISNITYLPKKGLTIPVEAFDVGPGNMIIDALMQKHYHLPYDVSGNVAKSGEIIHSLLETSLEHPFFAMNKPKSCGREQFGTTFFEEVLSVYKNEKIEDIITTMSVFTAKAIASQITTFYDPMIIDEVIVGGGGAHNDFILKQLREELDGIEVVTQEQRGFSSDAKEAIAFAMLGYETLAGRPSNVSSATGAQKSVILGKITRNPHGDK